MTKREHLQFLILMIPTLLLLAAVAVSMADLSTEPVTPVPQTIAAEEFVAAEPVWQDIPAAR